jgi:uncharacterized repeat protein (TIGR01451 family)
MMTRQQNAGLTLIGLLILMVGGSGILAQDPNDPGRTSPIIDPELEQAQYILPVARQAGPPTPPAVGMPPLPPTPVVQLVVLVPQDVAPQTNITYTIRVANTSAADAHSVFVRMPIPEGTQFVAAEPRPDTDTTKPNLGKLVWNLRTVEANGTRTLRVTVKPSEGTREVDARAYVSFEHGQQVKTRINTPKLKVRTETPRESVVGRSIPVRVVVTNEGRVPIQNVKLTANISEGFEFDRDSSGERTKEPRQRVWEIGTLPPGASRPVVYQVLAKEVRELVVQSVADGSHETQASDEAKTLVKEARLKIELRGDGTVDTGEDARYEAFIYNTGSLPLTNVRVTAEIPDGCRATGMTHNGRESRDQIVWIIEKMPPDDRPVSVRWKLASTESGRKTIRASAVAPQGAESSQQVETVFKGSAALHWDTSFDNPTVAVDHPGMLTVTVRNTGSEPAKNVRVEISVPREVSVIRATPDGEEKSGRVVFAARDIPPGKVVEYSLQFRGEQAGQAHFQPSLFADVLGPDPLRTNKYVEVRR